jgi:hypothetical protein
VISLEDPFLFFRTLLTVFLTVYFVLTTLSLLRQWWVVLAGGTREKELLRVYLAYQLLSIRTAALRTELAQIGLWLVALVVLLWAHDWVG